MLNLINIIKKKQFMTIFSQKLITLFDKTISFPIKNGAGSSKRKLMIYCCMCYYGFLERLQ